MEENNLDPGAIAGSGKDGRLTKSDVVGFLGKQPNGGGASGMWLVGGRLGSRGSRDRGQRSSPAATRPPPVHAHVARCAQSSSGYR